MICGLNPSHCKAGEKIFTNAEIQNVSQGIVFYWRTVYVCM